MSTPESSHRPPFISIGAALFLNCFPIGNALSGSSVDWALLLLWVGLVLLVIGFVRVARAERPKGQAGSSVGAYAFGGVTLLMLGLALAPAAFSGEVSGAWVVGGIPLALPMVVLLMALGGAGLILWSLIEAMGRRSREAGEFAPWRYTWGRGADVLATPLALAAAVVGARLLGSGAAQIASYSAAFVVGMGVWYAIRTTSGMCTYTRHSA